MGTFSPNKMIKKGGQLNMCSYGRRKGGGLLGAKGKGRGMGKGDGN